MTPSLFTAHLTGVQWTLSVCFVGRMSQHLHVYELMSARPSECVCVLQESRKHRRLMRKAATLEWEDLKEIASMKGKQIFEKPAAESNDMDSDDEVGEAPTTPTTASSGVGAAGSPGEALPAGSNGSSSSSSSPVKSTEQPGSP